VGTGAIIAAVTSGIVDGTNLRRAGGVDPLLDAKSALATPFATTPTFIELSTRERAVNAAGAYFLVRGFFEAHEDGTLGGIMLGVAAG